MGYASVLQDEALWEYLVLPTLHVLGLTSILCCKSSAKLSEHLPVQEELGARTRHHSVTVTHNHALSFCATQEVQREHDMSHQDKITNVEKVFGNSLHHFLMSDIAI